LKRVLGEECTEVVGGDDDAVFEFDADDGCAGDYGRLCVGYGAGCVEVGVVVCTIDVVSWLY